MKKLLALLLAASMVFGLTACGAEKAPETNAPAVTEAPAAQEQIETPVATEEPAPEEWAPSAQIVYPVTVVDQAGREVTIESEPEKVVSGYYISTSLLIALGQKEKLVGIEAKAGKRAIYKKSAPELIDLPNVGTAKEFDLEGCAALEPDLVILPKKLKDAAETLTGLGINVILVNPESKELLDECRDILADALNCKDEAIKLADFTDSQAAYLEETLKDAGKPSVYFAGNSGVLMTAGPAMYQGSLVTLAGGENVAKELEDTYWAEVSYEQILSWNPEVIIIASDAEYDEEAVLSDENLSEVDAVKNGKVYKLPGDTESWDSPVPSGVLGSYWIASMIHADLVGSEAFDKLAGEFYEEFYGFTY